MEPVHENSTLHVVLGGGGAAGSAVVRALASLGERVRAVNRSGVMSVPAGVETMAADVSDPAQAALACRGAGVVYNCASPPYDRWTDLFPVFMENITTAAGRAGARLIFADNLYMYGPVSGPLTEDTPYNPNNPKGEVRAKVAEDLLAAHRRGDAQAAIGRASDFYGPRTNSAMGVRIFEAALEDKPANIIGDPDQPHTYSYIDDFARGLILLGEREGALGEVWHIPNDQPTVTTRAFLEKVYAEAGSRLKIVSANKFLLTVLGLFNPTLREMRHVYYQFSEPFVVDHSKFERAFRPLPVTPQEQAIRETLEWTKSVRP